MDNLEALAAERAVLAIITGGVSELFNVAQTIAESAQKESDMVRSEDSNLSSAIHDVGNVFSKDLDFAIRDLLNRLLEDYRAYVASTVANESQANDYVLDVSGILKGVTEGVQSIVNKN